MVTVSLGSRRQKCVYVFTPHPETFLFRFQSLTPTGNPKPTCHRSADAEALYDRAVNVAERLLGTAHPITIAAREGLARLRFGR